MGCSISNVARSFLLGEQTLILAGCFEGGRCNSVKATKTEEYPLLRSDAEEADTRVWLHVINSTGSKKLLHSPDTDVYHIGTLVNFDNLDVYDQISSQTVQITRMLHLNQLILDLAADPGLALVPPSLKAHVLQTFFICSGCDYTSFFSGFGKATIMKCFFENAWFITGTHELPGTLADTVPLTLDNGFLSFVRLVGTMYFKKHLSVFHCNTPRALYMSLEETGLSPREQHKKFIQIIREEVWSRIEFEDELPPSFEALQRHWLRTCWVSNMWSQANKNHMAFLDLKGTVSLDNQPRFPRITIGSRGEVVGNYLIFAGIL